MRKEFKELQEEAQQLQFEVGELTKRNAQLEQELSEGQQKNKQLQDEMLNVRVTYDDLIQELKDSIAEGDVKIKTVGEELQITVGNKVLFQPGQAVLQKKGEDVLLGVARGFSRMKDYCMRVEGHTDKTAISKNLQDRYPTNWELSAARAAAVIRFLEGKARVNPQRLMLAGFGHHRPAASNDTTEGRKQNRRVEIFFVPYQSAKPAN